MCIIDLWKETIASQLPYLNVTRRSMQLNAGISFCFCSSVVWLIITKTQHYFAVYLHVGYMLQCSMLTGVVQLNNSGCNRFQIWFSHKNNVGAHISRLCQDADSLVDGICIIMLGNNWNSIQEWTTDRSWKKVMDFVSNVNVFDTSGYHHPAIPLIVLDNCQSVIKMLHSRAVTSPSYI